MSEVVLLRNIQVLLTLDHGHDGPAVGSSMRDLRAQRWAALAVRKGRVLEWGPDKLLARRYRGARVLEPPAPMVTPALVDPHTHPVFVHPRLEEWRLRLQGYTYEDLAARGGGILSSVRAVRAASSARLRGALTEHLRRLRSHGIALVEAKSGYGLSLEEELRQLAMLQWWNRRRASTEGIRVVPTCLAAHSVPPEFQRRPQAYVDLIVNRLLPEVRRRRLAERVDVFCERGVFEVRAAERILARARELGFRLTIHAEQLSRQGGGKLAAAFGADSADHLEYADPSTLRALREAGVACVLLPGAAFHLQSRRWAPARRMIDGGNVVALATDFNPGSSPIASPAVCMTLACMYYGMTPEEALTAFTLNAAYALRRHRRFGSLRPGRQAVVAYWRATDPAELAYHLGENLCAGVAWL